MKKIVLIWVVAISLMLLSSCINVDGADALAALENLNNEKMEKLEAEHKQELEQMQSEYEQQLATLELDYRSKISGLEDRIAGFDSQLAELQQKHNSEIEALGREYNDRLAELDKNYNSSIRGLEQERDRLIADKESLEQDYSKEVNRLNETIGKLQDELDVLKVNYDKTVAELEAMNGSNEALEKLKAEYEAEISKLTDERNTYLEEALAYNKAYKDKESELNAAIAQHESEIASLNESHAAEIEYINDEHSKEIESLNAQHNEHINNLNNEKASLVAELGLLRQQVEDLEAQLQSLIDGRSYYIIFDYGTVANGLIQYRTATHGALIDAAPAPPYINGYVLKEWLLDGVTPVTFPYIATRNAVLVAVYERDTYSIGFDTNGGSMTDYPKSYSTSEGVKLPSPERTGYMFNGWYETPDFKGQPMYSIPAGMSGDKMLYARWSPMHNNVTYTLRSGAAYTSPYYEVTAYTGGSSTVAIADEIDGIPVTVVNLGVFSGSGVSEIIIGNNVGKIYLIEALNCPMLHTFTVSSDNSRFFSYNGILYEKTDSGENKLLAYPTGKGESTVSIPSFTTVIGERAFSGTSISFVSIPEGVKRIGQSAFENCQSLYTVTLPAGVEYVDMWAFSKCSSLYQVVLPLGVRGISDHAFSDCRADITFFYCGEASDWVTVSLSASTGINASNLYYYSETKPYATGYYWHYLNGLIRIWENIDYGNGLAYDYGTVEGTCVITGIGNYADKDVVIPEYINGLRVVEIAERAFMDNMNITSVVIHASLQRIGDDAFNYCGYLRYVEITGNVTYIGARAFANTGIATIILPATLMYIGTNAFDNCWSMYAVYYSGSKSSWESGGFKIESTITLAYVLYYYAENTPTEQGYYWNRLSGEITTFYVPGPV